MSDHTVVVIRKNYCVKTIMADAFRKALAASK